MPIIRKHKRVTNQSVTRSKKQGGKNNTTRRGGKKKFKTKRKGGNKKTRRRRGGNPDEERAKQVEELMKQWKPVEGKGSLPDIPARKIATDVKETEAKEFKDFLREHVRSFDPKWRREDEFTAYRQSPRNIGLGKPFTAEQVVRYYADGFRNSEVRPDGLEKTLPGTTQEWYMLLPGGGWGNHPSERKGPFSANEIGDSIFTNTKLVDRPQTLSAYLSGEGRRLGPRTSLGYRPAGALKALRTERDKYKRGWVSGGKKRKTRKRKGGGRKEDIAAVMKELLPDVPAENIAGQVEAMEEKKRFNFGMYVRKFKKHDDGLLSRGLSDAKSIADLHHTPREKDVKDWYLENGEGPFSPKEIGHAVFKDTEEQSLFDFLYYHPTRAWARIGGGRLEDIAAVMKEWQPVEGKPPLPDIPAENIANKVVEREPRDPPQLTSSQWLELKGYQRVRGIAFQIETPTTIIFNSRLNPSDMSKIKLKFPPEPLGSIAPLIPKRGDRVVAVDNNPIEDIKYLLGTVTSATKPRGQPVTEGFTLKIRTPVEYDTGPGPMPAASLNLNKNNFRIKVINEETPRPGPPLLDGFRFGGRGGNKPRKRRGGI